jgi:signal transduction histidine kinase
MAAHEIRNPLTVISGTVELMQLRSSTSLSERDRAALKDVLGEVDRLRRLTEDLLDLAADRPLARARLDVGRILDEAARAAEAAFPQVRVRRALPPLPPVEGDAARLRQVFANLLTNAAQAQRDGELDLVASSREASVVVEVRDNGPGISPEVRAKLFDPFVTGKANGTGLGLAISRRIVERHGGSLQLLQDGRPGATFEVRLPSA